MIMIHSSDKDAHVLKLEDLWHDPLKSGSIPISINLNSIYGLQTTETGQFSTFPGQEIGTSGE
jgi:hypothetical protein